MLGCASQCGESEVRSMAGDLVAVRNALKMQILRCAQDDSSFFDMNFRDTTLVLAFIRNSLLSGLT
jgi:hypothetical protein